jgi:LacI family transcriptional regulator
MKIKDVAKLAGVSTATVSHVINNTRFVREETRQRVQDAIDRVNYTPNAHARSLASGHSQTLGLIISDVANPFFPELVKSIQRSAAERGYDVILANTNYDQVVTVSCVERMLQQKVRGVAIMTSEMDYSLIDRLLAKEVSVVFLDLGPVGPHTSNINVDYENGIRAGVKHLLGLGHRRIAFLGGPRRLKSAERRRVAFVDTMRRYRRTMHTTPVLLEGDFTAEGGRRAAREIVAMSERPTALLAANDLMAIGALRELHRSGLHVPRDISVVGFDDISFAALTEPPLTTISFPRAEIGRAAVDALMHTIGSPDSAGQEVRVSTHLVVRESTGEATGPNDAQGGSTT